MKKIILLTIFSFAIHYMYAQQGNGCANAQTIAVGTHKIDTFYKGVNTFKDATQAKWYKYTPSQDGLMTVSSCNSGSDTRVFVYTGNNCNSLVLFAYNDDYCAIKADGDELAASVSRIVKGGQTYFFEWDDAWDSTKFTFTLTFAANFTAGETQTCSTAKTINPGTIKVDSVFGFATRGDASRANWYKFTPTRNGKISIGSCGEDADTRLWIYEGTCSGLTKIEESDDECISSGVDQFAASVTNLAVKTGVSYYFEWDDFSENTPFNFNFTFDGNTSIKNDEKLSNQIIVSPNPATNYINLIFDLEKNSDITVTILNTVGQSVFYQKYPSILRGGQVIDTKNFKSGLYIIKITEGQKQAIKKVIVHP